MIPITRSLADSRPSGPAVRRHTIRRLVLGAVLLLLLLLPLLGGCGSKDDKDADWRTSSASVPVETLRITTASMRCRRSATPRRSTSSMRSSRTIRSRPGRRARQLHGGLRAVFAEPLHRRADRSGWLHQAAPGESPDVPRTPITCGALCYYEQIVSTFPARPEGQRRRRWWHCRRWWIASRAPLMPRDARLKIDLCRDHIAGANMEIGRWGMRASTCIPPAATADSSAWWTNTVTTNQVPEALHRLVEIYLILGLKDEAKRIGRRCWATTIRARSGVRRYLRPVARCRPGARRPGAQRCGQRAGVYLCAPGIDLLETGSGPVGMLTALSIRDVVLIARLDLGFGAGLTVLTGETGGGKSILLDSLGLALGARAEAGLVRTPSRPV